MKPLILAFLVFAPTVVPASAQVPCRLELDGSFAADGLGPLQQHLPADVVIGQPIACATNGPTGDTVQLTDHGILYWSRAARTMNFTDGATHWAYR